MRGVRPPGLTTTLAGALLALLFFAAAAATPAPAQPRQFNVSWFVGFNVTQPPFDNMAARQAVAAAIDRDRVAELSGEELATSLQPRGCLAHNPDARMRGYDPKQARDLLARAGVRPDDYSELGLWVLSLVLTDPDWKLGMDHIVGDLKAIGFSTRIRDFGNYDALTRIATQPVVKMSYWGLRLRDCSKTTFVELLIHSRGDFNLFGYNSRDVDRLIDRAKQAPDRQTAVRLYQEAEQRILDEAVVIPIFWYP